MVGCCYFTPVASRVSARQPSYFFLRRQKKVTKKKASHVRAASRCLALLAAFGALANSLRSDNASALIRTLLRCSARPNGGGIPLGSSASRTSPEGLVRCAHIAECWGCLISHASLLTRARHAVPLRPHPQGNHKGCPYDLTPHSTPSFRVCPGICLAVAACTLPTAPHGARARARHAVPLRPHSSLLRPHSYDLTPTTSLLRPHSYDLTPTTSLLRPHSYDLTPTTSLLRPHSYDLTPHSSLLTPHSSLLFLQKMAIFRLGYASRS